MAIKLIGSASGNIAEVDADLAARVAPYPSGVLGAYRKAMTSGTIAAGLTAASAVYGFKFAPSPTTNLALVKHVRVSMGDLVGFAAGFVAINMFMARPYTTLDTTGGTQGTFSGNNGKLRTSHPTSSGATCAISTTAAISGGASTLDTDPIATVSGSVVATAGQPPIVNGFDLWGPVPGEYPLVLASGEGFVVKVTVPATGTWQLGVDVQWDEVLGASFPM